MNRTLTLLGKNRAVVEASKMIARAAFSKILSLTLDKSLDIEQDWDEDIIKIDFRRDSVYYIEANPEKGFNYPYFLRIPEGTDVSQYQRLIVETNNTLADTEKFFRANHGTTINKITPYKYGR